MSRTPTEILSGLDPHNPATLQALIDFHRDTFGGYAMKDEEAADGGAKPEDQANNKKDEAGAGKDGGGDGKDGNGDKQLGATGLKALQAERDARKALETELKEFKAAQQEQATRLAGALGIKTKDSASSEDVVAALQTQVQQMQHDNLVYRVITDPAHPVTDADDTELIKAAPDEATMRKLAARLTKKAENQGTSTNSAGSRRLPRPDPSQGRGGSEGSQAKSVAQVMAGRAAARAAKN